jgi:L-fucose mutarotase/ribose pyranase (RbsD/FucU family)
MSVGLCAHATRIMRVFFVFVFGKFHRRDYRIVVFLEKRLYADILLKKSALLTGVIEKM